MKQTIVLKFYDRLDITKSFLASQGMTVLHWAAFHNRPKHVQILMDRGVNVLTKDIDGKTALHWAAQVSWRLLMSSS